ncbi:MAG: GbsR/MarR family transcriptional regulator [Armatimonadota bacterium]
MTGGTELEAESAGEAKQRELEERFILHWGEMASQWGINRTMGQIHALLYVRPEPLSAEEIMERLQISRGNASMNLRNLEDWGIIQRVHVRGDRREYFKTTKDVWELMRMIVRERKRREFDPTLRSLREFLADADDDPALSEYRERLSNLLSMLELLQGAFDRLLPADPGTLPKLLEVQVEGLD